MCTSVASQSHCLCITCPLTLPRGLQSMTQDMGDIQKPQHLPALSTQDSAKPTSPQAAFTVCLAQLILPQPEASARPIPC